MPLIRCWSPEFMPLIRCWSPEFMPLIRCWSPEFIPSQPRHGINSGLQLPTPGWSPNRKTLDVFEPGGSATAPFPKSYELDSSRYIYCTSKFMLQYL
jgi:hypothetical protein